MSGTSRIPVSLDNLDKFSGENVANVAQNQAVMNYLNVWAGQLFFGQMLPVTSPARSPEATVGDRWGTIYIYHHQQDADAFVSFYDYYRERLNEEEKTAFEQMTEGEKDIRLKAAAYALAAGSEPVFAVQTGATENRPDLRVMYPKAEPTIEVPKENFGMFARFMRAVLPRRMYPNFVKTEQEKAISRAEDTYDSIKGDVTAAAETLKDVIKAETDEANAAAIAARAVEAHKLMVAEAQRRQLMGIDENAEQKDPRANFVVNHEEYAASGTQLDVSLYADSMHNIRLVQKDFPDLQLHDIRFDREEGRVDRANAGYVGRARTEMSFNRDQYAKGLINDNFGMGADGRYEYLATDIRFTAAHESGHLITMGITRLLYGEQLYNAPGTQPVIDFMFDPKTEANFAHQAMMNAYDADPKFRADMDKAVSNWDRYKKDTRRHEISISEEPKHKRMWAGLFMARTTIMGTEETPIERRDDIYADLYKMGYTSRYGASAPIEFTAEAIGDYYYVRETNKNLAEGQAPMRVNPLSEQMFKLTKELYNSPDARLSFAEKYSDYYTRYNMTVLREVADNKRYGVPQQDAQAQQDAQPSVNRVEIKLDNKGNETLATDPPPERKTHQDNANKGREQSEPVKEEQNIDMTKGVRRATPRPK